MVAIHNTPPRRKKWQSKKEWKPEKIDPKSAGPGIKPRKPGDFEKWLDFLRSTGRKIPGDIEREPGEDG